MLFNSLSYALFLPVVFLLYWALPHRARWCLLLLASYFFYMCWNARYGLLLLFMTLLSYTAGRLVEPRAGRRDALRGLVLFGTLFLSLFVLCIFKYLDFLWDSLSALFSICKMPFPAAPLRLLLPVGISFYTFQAIAYVLDVYRGAVPAERHFGIYACFLSFFPQLVAGPIERTRNLLPQLKKEQIFDYDEAAYGMRLMVLGFFKKLVLADTLALYVDRVFNDLPAYRGFSLFLSLCFFSIQIYCDFSGYSDIAVGSARLLGIHLMQNFHSPFLSESFRAFWQNWHISLSGWFRDYVYIPLGGNRVSPVRRDLNLFLTFLLSGLWHGAGWTYVLWGAVHGGMLVLEGHLREMGKRVFSGKHSLGKSVCSIGMSNDCPGTGRHLAIAGAWSAAVCGLPVWRMLRIAFIFLICTLAWPFFRATCFSDALYVFTHLFSGIAHPLSYLHDGFAVFGIARYKWLAIALCVLLLFLYDLCSLREDPILLLSRQSALCRRLTYLGFLLLILFFRASGETAFVYFQF